tara:strand:+ start:12378 stop:12698 length:321 start_codon:yes stop_codon:yes gene_type:complete
LKITKFKPVNRHIHIVPHTEEPKQESGVLLPENYNPEQTKYVTANVIAVAADCNSQIQKSFRAGLGSLKIIVDRSMIELVETKNKKLHVILENYVVGLLDTPDILD